VQDLDSIWETEAPNWAGASEAAVEAAEALPKHNAELSPEQLHLISAHFDKARLFASNLHPVSLPPYTSANRFPWVQPTIDHPHPSSLHCYNWIGLQLSRTIVQMSLPPPPHACLRGWGNPKI
jgi:hypothetical protein